MEMTNTLKAFNSTLIHVLNLEQCELESCSKEYQNNIKSYIQILEQTTQLINNLDLFSSNETLDDLQTSYLKFLLIPALLGFLQLRTIGENRLEILNLSKVYFEDFLTRLNSYKIINVDVKQLIERTEDDLFPKNQPSLEQMVKERNEKLRVYNESKALDEKLVKLKYILESDQDSSSLDDEVVRDFFISLAKRWTNKIIDEIKSLMMEKFMLENRPPNHSNPVKSYVSAANFKPFIITRNEMEKKIFGLGYPSRPTVTIEEFVNQKIAEGSLSVTTEDYKNSLQKWAEDPNTKNEDDERDNAEKDRLADKDDETSIQKARQWDDWKDEHRRGEGNRMNMG